MKDKIFRLQTKIREGKIGSAVPWQGADVMILEKAPNPSNGNFYPDPRFVETKFVEELSWIFEQLRDIFWKSDGYGAWKEEFFGRLGNVATRFQSAQPECSVFELLETVTLEAVAMVDEITQDGDLPHLLLTVENRIIDDFVMVSDSNDYLPQEKLKKMMDLIIGDWNIEIDGANQNLEEGLR